MSFFMIDDHFIIHKGVPVSFILIGKMLVNMMAVVKVQYSPAGERAESLLCVCMVTGDPLVFTGDEADLVWEKFAKMGTPLQKA